MTCSSKTHLLNNRCWILLRKDLIINLCESCSCHCCCCVIHNNNIFLLLCNTQQQHHTITSKLTEMFYRNTCMTDLSSCSTPNDKIYKVTTYIKLHRMYTCIPCTAFGSEWYLSGGVHQKLYWNKYENWKFTLALEVCFGEGLIWLL